MPFCSNCGGAVGEDVRFCPQCGREVGSAEGGPAPASSINPAGLDKNIAGLLCYALFFITGILFLLLEPYNRNPFIRFHARQSIFFSITVFVVSAILGAIPFVGWLLWPPVELAFLVLWVVLMVQAYQGKKWKLPVIGDLAEPQA